MTLMDGWMAGRRKTVGRQVVDADMINEYCDDTALRCTRAVIEACTATTVTCWMAHEWLGAKCNALHALHARDYNKCSYLTPPKYKYDHRHIMQQLLFRTTTMAHLLLPRLSSRNTLYNIKTNAATIKSTTATTITTTIHPTITTTALLLQWPATTTTHYYKQQTLYYPY